MMVGRVKWWVVLAGLLVLAGCGEAATSVLLTPTVALSVPATATARLPTVVLLPPTATLGPPTALPPSPVGIDVGGLQTQVTGPPPTVAATEDGGPPAPQAGATAPDFVLTRLDTGERLRLGDLAGRPIWLNFWATWCPPCKAEMISMQQVYMAHKDTPLVMLGVDVNEDADQVRKYVAAQHYTWTFALDPQSHTALDYNLTAIPTHVFIGKDGVIQAVVLSGLTQRQMETYVAALLK